MRVLNMECLSIMYFNSRVNLRQSMHMYTFLHTSIFILGIVDLVRIMD